MSLFYSTFFRGKEPVGWLGGSIDGWVDGYRRRDLFVELAYMITEAE